MAIYHLTVTTGTRSGGQSAKAKSDYINREGRYAHDADEVMHRISGNMPDWVEDGGGPKDYWNLADIYERANGRLYKEVQFSLPKELDEAQMVELAETYARSLTEDEKLPYSLAIHYGGWNASGGDSENPHCHLMISERVNDGVERDKTKWFKRANVKQPGEGGAKKTTSLMPKAWLYEVREQWAEMANEALREAGVEEQIDHRSYKDQGVQTVPLHFGRAVLGMQDRGIETVKQAEYMAAFESRQIVEELKNEFNRTDAEIQERGGFGRGTETTGRSDGRAGDRIQGTDQGSEAGERAVGQGNEASPGRSSSIGRKGQGGSPGTGSGSEQSQGTDTSEGLEVPSDDSADDRVDSGGSVTRWIRGLATGLRKDQSSHNPGKGKSGTDDQAERTQQGDDTRGNQDAGNDPGQRSRERGSGKQSPEQSLNPKSIKPKPRKQPRNDREDEGWER